MKKFEIVLIAHDGKKAEMTKFLKSNIDFFLRDDIKIIATSSTGKRAEEIGIKVKKMLSGPIGGDAEIASRVANGKSQMVFFFKDPMISHPHEADVNMLARVCNVHNVPLATNQATAQLLLNALRMV